MADKEIGSVLIAINSYVNPRTHLKPLLNIDQAFLDYIKAFYSRLFFHVEVLVDFSYTDLEKKLKSFAQNSVGSRIAAVFLCHGGLNLSGAECIYTNDAHPVLVVEIENFFHRNVNSQDKNKYLFFDACRSDTSGDESTSRLVYKASVDKTFVVFSTLPFHKAYVGGSYSLWSYWFTQKIVNQMLLDNVVASVDDEIRSEIREKLGITHEGQVSEVSKLGAVENPNLRAIAAAENQGRTRDLSVELVSFITERQKIMTEYRQKLSDVPAATTLREPIDTLGSAKSYTVSVGPNHPSPTTTTSISPKVQTVGMSEKPPKDGVFDSKSFMKVYSDAFVEIVPADKIARSLKIEGVIDEVLCHKMTNCSRTEAVEMLYDHLYEAAKRETIAKLCKVMKKKSDGYPKMWDLADAMEKNKPYKP